MDNLSKVNSFLLTGMLLLLVIVHAPPAAAQGSNVVSIAGNVTAPGGNNITVPIMIYNATDIAAVGVKLSYNASVVNVTDAVKGDFTHFFGFDNSNAANGWVTINTFMIGTQLTGDLIIGTVTLEAVGNTNEQSSLDIEILSITDKNGSDLSADVDNGSFIVSDITAPSVTNPAASPPMISNDGTTYSQLNIIVTDESSIASVTVDLSAINGPADQPMSHSGNVWTCTTNASALPGIYELLVNATDSWGNSNTSVTIPLKVVEPALVSIGSLSAVHGESSTAPIMIYNATDTASIGLKFSYNASVVNVTGAEPGDFTFFFAFDNSNAANGWATINTFMMGTQLTGDLIVTNVTLQAVGSGGDTSQLYLSDLVITDKYGNNIPWTADEGTFTIISRPPVLDPIGNKIINEAETLIIALNATDPDEDVIAYSCNRTDLFMDFNPITGTGNWTTDYQDAGIYRVDFGVSDGNGGTANETIRIEVINVNRPPVLDPVGDKIINEAETLIIALNAADSDGDTLTFSASNLPAGATFNPADQTFSWTPTFEQAGVYENVHFEVTDGILTDWENIMITVNNVNRAPAISGLVNQSGIAGSAWTYDISSCISDPDGDLPTVTTDDDNISVSGFVLTFNYAVAVEDKTVLITVTDAGGLSGSQTVFVAVAPENIPPIITNPTSSQSVDEGQTLSFTVSATDPNGDALTFSASNLPAGATFNPANQMFSWTPTFEQAGVYENVHFEVTDGILTDWENITITVNNVNRAPAISGLVNQSGIVDVAWTYDISSYISDPDGDMLTVTAGDDNISVSSFVLTFNYSVVVEDKTVIITVTDGSLSNSQTIFVTAMDNTPPTLTDPTASQLIPDDTDNDPQWGEIATLNITVTDDSSISGVTINLSTIGGSAVHPMNNIAGDIWSVATNASAGTSPQTYYLQVNAADIYGNSNTSVSIPLVVMQNGDTSGNNEVNVGDAMLLANYVAYPGQYSISSEYVADVTGDGAVNIADPMLLANHVAYHDQGYILR